jgi:uncharacterized protein YbcV (DUF1398 family)
MDTIIGAIDAANAHAAAVRPKVGGFPYLAEALRVAGVRKYYFDVPSCTVRYATAAGDVLAPGAFLRTEKTVIRPFDEDALVTAIRVDQLGRSTFPEFVESTFRAGVIRYEVDTAARTCSYFGTGGERYVEQYPAVDLPPAVTALAVVGATVS